MLIGRHTCHMIICLPMQDELKVWSTTCPPFIMPPALYPGEVVQLKEHRILCMDATSKPLIGAVFITNYRVIFSGNPVEVSFATCLLIDVNTEGPLYSGHHWDPAVCPVYRGTSL